MCDKLISFFRISHRQDSKLATMIKQNLVGEKMMWMKEHMNLDVCPYTPELTAELLLKYAELLFIFVR